MSVRMRIWEKYGSKKGSIWGEKKLSKLINSGRSLSIIAKRHVKRQEGGQLGGSLGGKGGAEGAGGASSDLVVVGGALEEA